MHVNSYVSLRTWDSTGTSISGAIPATWNVLVALQQLNIGQTNVRCDLIVNAHNKLKCADQTVLRKSPTHDHRGRVVGGWECGSALQCTDDRDHGQRQCRGSELPLIH